MAAIAYESSLDTSFDNTMDATKGYDPSQEPALDRLAAIEHQVSASLHRVNEYFDPDKPGSALFELTSCARSASLTDYVRSKNLEDLIAQVPAVGDLVHEISERAHEVLETTSDVPSSVEVESLGIAADLTGDQEILEQALDALDNTGEEKYEPFRLALEKALSDNVLFVDAKRIVEKELRERQLQKIVPPSRRPDYDADAPNAYLSHWQFPATEVVGRTAVGTTVNMQSYNDLYADTVSDVTHPVYDPDRHMTVAEQYRLQGRLAVDEFLGRTAVSQSKRLRN